MELSLISRMKLTLSPQLPSYPDRHPLTFTNRDTPRALVSQQVISEKSWCYLNTGSLWSRRVTGILKAIGHGFPSQLSSQLFITHLFGWSGFNGFPIQMGQCRGHGFSLWPRKIPYATEPQSPSTTTIEPVLWSPGATSTEPTGRSCWSPWAREPVLKKSPSVAPALWDQTKAQQQRPSTVKNK